MKKVTVKTEYKKEYFVEDVLHELYNEFACQPDLDYDHFYDDERRDRPQHTVARSCPEAYRKGQLSYAD